MAGSPGNSRRGATGVVGVLLAVLAVGGAVGWGGATAGKWVSDLLSPLCAGLGACVVVLAARRLPRRRRPGWHLLAAALGCWAVGEAIFSYYELVAHIDAPLPSIADVAYLAAYPLALAGLVVLTADRLRLGRVRSVLDGFLLTGAALLVSLPLVIEPTLHAGSASALADAVATAYPVWDVLLLAVVVLALTRSVRDRGGARSALGLLLLGLLLQVVCDSVYAELSLHSGYASGGMLDSGWCASYLLLAFAAVWDDGREVVTAQAPRRWESLLPYVVVSLAMLGTVVAWEVRGRIDRASLLVLGTVLAALLARQLTVVVKNAQLMQRLEGLAFTDELTGLANRPLLLNRLDHTLVQRGTDSVCFLLLDLDGFKGINDTLGHAAGDQLLQQAAGRLRAATRTGDTICRLGGDEFGVLLDGHGGVDEGVRTAQRLLDALTESYLVDGVELRVSASIGVAVVQAGEDRGALLQRADLAMYAAKAQGRSRFAVYDPDMQLAVLRRLTLERELRDAIANDEFVVAYQPVVELTGGRILGVEALVRWESPLRGTVSPLDFIPVAEDCGLIGAIGRRVLQLACEQVQSWRRLGHDLTLSVNVSPRQLTSSSFSAEVAATLVSSGLPGDRLVLELTEGVLVDETAPTAGTLQLLRALGIQIAIDDFGTGWSSLSYLRRLPVDIVKIDRSFVRDLGRDDGVESVTRAIVTLSRDLKLVVVAEGVEEHLQLASLTGMGCQLAQGFLLARPLAAETLAALLGRPVDVSLPDATLAVAPAAVSATETPGAVA